MTVPKLTRIAKIIPGFDCMLNECIHEPKQVSADQHGRSGEDWYYVVRREDDPNQISAVSLEVSTAKYPSPTVHNRLPPEGVSARSLVYHIAFPYIDADNGVPYWPSSKERGRDIGVCSALGTSVCATMPDSALYPREFCEKHGFDHSQFEQGEHFWLALEAEWHRQDAMVQRFDVKADAAKRDAWIASPHNTSASHNDITRWLHQGQVEQRVLQAKIDTMLSHIVPTFLRCPKCNEIHVDEHEWVTRAHRTHQCQKCQHLWRPFEVSTRGVPAFADDEAHADRLLEVRENVIEVLKRARNLCISLKGCDARKDPALPGGVVEQFDRLRYELAQLGVGELK